jgi:hypothetical protein
VNAVEWLHAANSKIKIAVPYISYAYANPRGYVQMLFRMGKWMRLASLDDMKVIYCWAQARPIEENAALLKCLLSRA